MSDPTLADLLKKLCPTGAPGFTSTLTHIELTCTSGFEVNAYEDWGFGWSLKLPQYPYHWRGNDGVWIRGTSDGCMSFGARTPETCICKALNFLEDWEAGKFISHEEYQHRVDTHYYRDRMKR
jgi:hypothetical protein